MNFDDIDKLRSLSAPLPDKATTQRLLDSIQRTLEKDTYVRRWWNAIDTIHNFRQREPWQAIGEQRAQALYIAAGNFRLPPIADLDEWQTRAFLSVRILVATPYLWLNDMASIARASPLPPHVVSRSALHQPFMFWSMETAWPVRFPSQDEAEFEKQETNWILHCDDGMGIASYRDILRVPTEPLKHPGDRYPNGISSGMIEFGKAWPNDFADEFREAVGLNLQMMAFLNSPYTAVEQHHPPRSLRRDAQRSGALPIRDGVRVVQLRQRPNRQRSGETGESHDWQHQWWVRAHYRAQWYPSEQAHHVVWISPYLKGPSDKPLLSHGSTVFKVAR